MKILSFRAAISVAEHIAVGITVLLSSGTVTQAETLSKPSFTIFPLETAVGTRIGSLPEQIAVGPDGNLWFTEIVASKIGRITPQGDVSEFPLANNVVPEGIAAGPDGAVWFTEELGNKIGRIQTKPPFAITEYALPAVGGNGNGPTHIIVGPDGNLWFNEAFTSKIARIDPRSPGEIKEWARPGAKGAPNDLTIGPDGNIWFTEGTDGNGGSVIVRMKLGDPIKFTAFDYRPRVAESYSGIAGIVAGPDGALWIAGGGANNIIRVPAFGSDDEIRSHIRDFDLPTPHSIPLYLTVGPDGNIWFTENGATYALARLTLSGKLTEYKFPTNNCVVAPFFGTPSYACEPRGIKLGPDGRLWIAEFGANAIARADIYQKVYSGEVQGPVIVDKGETAIFKNAQVRGDIFAYGAGAIYVCATHVHGNLTAYNSKAWGAVGNVGAGDIGFPCGSSMIDGNVVLNQSEGGFAVARSRIGGSILAIGNFDGRINGVASGLQFLGNTIDYGLFCYGNLPSAPTNRGVRNAIGDGTYGQCKGL